ncbi:GTP cyclohydrolase II RibA [Cellulosimicrobium sp. Marseille-Q8652]
MMRLDDAAALAARDGLVLLTIADLVAWRRLHDPAPAAPEEVDRGLSSRRVHRTAEAALPTEHGVFRVRGYRDLRTGAEHVALVPAEPGPRASVPAVPSASASGAAPVVRVHSECLTGDAFGSARCDCGPQRARRWRGSRRRVVRWCTCGVTRAGGSGCWRRLGAYEAQDAGLDTVQANLELGWPADRREYGAAAAILADLGLSRVTLLTNNPAKVTGLVAHGIDVVGTERIEVGHGEHNRAYLVTKKVAMGHLLETVEAPGGPGSGGVGSVVSDESEEER